MRQDGLLGKDGDAAFLLHPLGVQERVAVIHPALLPHRAAQEQHRFAQRRFARVHVRRQPDHASLSRHRRALLWFDGLL